MLSGEIVRLVSVINVLAGSAARVNQTTPAIIAMTSAHGFFHTRISTLPNS